MTKACSQQLSGLIKFCNLSAHVVLLELNGEQTLFKGTVKRKPFEAFIEAPIRFIVSPSFPSKVHLSDKFITLFFVVHTS